jgi:hypothetical protein
VYDTVRKIKRGCKLEGNGRLSILREEEKGVLEKWLMSDVGRGEFHPVSEVVQLVYHFCFFSLYSFCSIACSEHDTIADNSRDVEFSVFVLRFCETELRLIYSAERFPILHRNYRKMYRKENNELH